MNWDHIQGNWKQFSGPVQDRWGKLTDREITEIAGKREHLAGLIQKHYGYEVELVEKELAEFPSILTRRV